MVWDSVFREQARQRYLGIQDPTMMQLVSCHATQWARDSATTSGMTDAQVALEIFVQYMQEQQEDASETEIVEEDESELQFDDLTPIQVSYYGDENEGRIDSQVFNIMMKDSSMCNAREYRAISTGMLRIPEALDSSLFAAEISPHDGPANMIEQLEVALRLWSAIAV